jgi:hypothetical protein
MEFASAAAAAITGAIGIAHAVGVGVASVIIQHVLLCQTLYQFLQLIIHPSLV